MDEPIPALDGKTPRATSLEPALRPKLLRWRKSWISQPLGRERIYEVFTGWLDGGADRNRTCDLLIANETLYQLSYDPIQKA